MLLEALHLLLVSSTFAFAALELHPSTSASYPFSIHLPLNSTNNNTRNSTAPPAIVSLHGSGSRGTADEVGDKTRWDGVGWLISQFESGNRTGAQQIVAEEYLTILPLLPESTDAWDSQGVISVLNAVAELARNDTKYAFDTSRVTLAGYSIGAYGAWYTAFNYSYPTPFSSIVAFGGSSGLTKSRLSTLVDPPQNVSTLSIYAAGGSIDEKQPGSAPKETLSQLDKLADPGLSRNWTAVELEGMNHKTMSQQAWFDMGWIEAPSLKMPIPFIPPEIVSEILSQLQFHLGDDDHQISDNVGNSTSLVCRSWRPLGQALCWREISIKPPSASSLLDHLSLYPDIRELVQVLKIRTPIPVQNDFGAAEEDPVTWPEEDYEPSLELLTQLPQLRLVKFHLGNCGYLEKGVILCSTLPKLEHLDVFGLALRITSELKNALRKGFPVLKYLGLNPVRLIQVDDSVVPIREEKEEEEDVGVGSTFSKSSLLGVTFLGSSGEGTDPEPALFDVLKSAFNWSQVQICILGGPYLVEEILLDLVRQPNLVTLEINPMERDLEELFSTIVAVLPHMKHLRFLEVTPSYVEENNLVSPVEIWDFLDLIPPNLKVFALPQIAFNPDDFYEFPSAVEEINNIVHESYIVVSLSPRVGLEGTMSSQIGQCVVCGKDCSTRCSACAAHELDWMFFCSTEHQKLIWFTHKRVCGRDQWEWQAHGKEERILIEEQLKKRFSERRERLNYPLPGDELAAMIESMGARTYEDILVGFWGPSVLHGDIPSRVNKGMRALGLYCRCISLKGQMTGRQELAVLSEDPFDWLSNFEGLHWKKFNKSDPKPFFDKMHHRLLILFTLLSNRYRLANFGDELRAQIQHAYEVRKLSLEADVSDKEGADGLVAILDTTFAQGDLDRNLRALYHL
ncbi:uncharacterized protein JCM6883_003870 [Sporobolomyces salmoneus]|uniref:uncharacterized protein n=1 Tax=Sporobolomyces salmoneus TaxID=183962 RepID=UPI00316F0DBC